MKNIWILFLCISCSTAPQKNFHDYLIGGQCESAVKNLPDKTASVMNQTKYVSGTIASYALTGLTYGTEVTMYLVGGVVGGLVICTPAITADVAMKSSGQFTVECLKLAGNVLTKVKPKEMFGEKVYDKTRNWRCPDLTDFSKNLRSIASCYEDKNTRVDLKKSIEQLDIIRNQDFQENCIGDEERIEILNQYDRIIKKIATKVN